jgi:predicted nucleotidyltransferase
MLEGSPLAPRDAAAVAAFAERVRACLGETLVGLRLFGSKARGEAHEESDIDIAVIVSGDRLAAEDAAIDIAFDVNLAHDVYISPRVILADVFEHPVWRVTHFVQAVQREGVPL